ncbi:Uncharacterised protein [Mycobacterium tuberculosis]|uniref:Uncharacterized protein n=1 Tax=Mycobacterium tuberculosis TaxID=1773 RepID=A0A655JSK1_MYCTX|nr:Uncharacterised protein [Mycobacterium tuberculosis]COX63998.1 Uncharacterised protein [Mycobacterium tuberculosis]
MSWVYWVLSVARPCSRVGMMSNGNCAAALESAVVTALVPLARAVACPVAAAWPASPDGLVVCGGAVNGVSREAVAEELA